MGQGKHEAPKKARTGAASKSEKSNKESKSAKETKKAKSTKKTTAPKHVAETKRSGGKTGFAIAAMLVIVIIAGLLVTGYLAGSSDSIHPNMTLGGVSIGDMSVEEAAQKLTDAGWKYEGEPVEVTLPGEYKFTVTAAEAGMDMSCAEAAQAAFDYGHSGSLFDDLAAYFKCITGGVSERDIMKSADISGVRARVDKELGIFAERMGKGYEIDEEAELLVMVKGAKQIDIDADKLCGDIVQAFADGKNEVSYGVTGDAETDFDELHDKICGEVLDAQYDPETQKATESRVGIEFDVKTAQKLWDAAEAGETIKIPIEVTMPKYTQEQLDEMLFADKLGAMTTGYSTSTENRATNVELSAKKINGVILQPGETFSYNTVVGKRTAEAGFKAAGAYAGGQVVQEIGGGICQTSSTLYCAALYANLEIVARDEHGFAVSYVPWGLDATVSWGGPEFKFKNNRELPVKIVAHCENRKLTIEIWGTDLDGSYVEMDYSAWTVYDETYPEVAIGTRAVTYRCVYDKDGELISREKEANSYYHYHPENIQWPEESPAPDATPEPTPGESTADPDAPTEAAPTDP